MNNKLVFSLTVVCAGLMLIIIGEWWYAQHTRTQLLSAVSPTSANAGLDEMPSLDLTQQTEDSYADLVARPLFIKGRKPVDEPPPGQSQVNAVAVKFDWLLIGIYTSEHKLHALFARETTKVPRDNYRKVLEGGDLDGWKLSKIDKDQVTLVQDGSEKHLPLRKPKLKQLPNKPGNQPQQPGPDEAMPEAPEEQLEPELEPTEEEPIENE